MFSELIDGMLVRSGRRDRLSDLTTYLNMTIREVDASGDFVKSHVEEVIPISGNPTTWPRPVGVKNIVTVQYPGLIYPDPIPVGPLQRSYIREGKPYFYESGNYVVFANAGDLGSINVAFQQRPKRLLYYEEGNRPAVWDETERLWTYLPAYDVDDATRTLARSLVTNWLLINHQDTLEEGTLAKLFALTEDKERSRVTYSLFKQMLASVMQEEVQVMINVQPR